MIELTSTSPSQDLGAPASSAPVASVVITTRNRKEALRNAIESALAQHARVEVLVIDDASTDGTLEMVRSEFPAVRIVRSEKRRGLIAQRNVAAKLATAPIIFSLDDDAVFTSPETVGEVMVLFSNPLVGAVRLPFKNIVLERIQDLALPLPDDSGLYVTDVYPGCAHALRRNLFNQLGGYFEPLFHWGEETGYCQKLYDAGRAVAVHRGHAIHHFPHPAGRHTRARNAWIYRNLFLLATIYAPGYALPREWLLALAKCTRYAIRSPLHSPVIIEGVLRGIWASFVNFSQRRPVSMSAYVLFNRLKKRRVVELAEIEGELKEFSCAARGIKAYADQVEL